MKAVGGSRIDKSLFHIDQELPLQFLPVKPPFRQHAEKASLFFSSSVFTGKTAVMWSVPAIKAGLPAAAVWRQAAMARRSRKVFALRKVITPSDCTSSQTEEIQQANLSDMERMGALIINSQEFEHYEKHSVLDLAAGIRADMEKRQSSIESCFLIRIDSFYRPVIRFRMAGFICSGRIT